ncbi:hypothetical protein FQA39_LY16845 [Lamprigera yunnana]|nr:hypothetical protein FQA39_LY16845 [Lamprigera yunnana]
MYFKVDIDRYSKDELEYELSIRGITESGLEEAGNVVYSNVSLDGSSELDICQNKLRELSSNLSSFTGTSNQIKNLDTKLDHVYGRVDRIQSKDPVLISRRFARRGNCVRS